MSISTSLYHLRWAVAQEVKRSIQVACIESKSIVVEDKQNYYHSLPGSVKAHLACHSNSCFVCKWYIVGRNSWELCHLSPFVLVRQRGSIITSFKGDDTPMVVHPEKIDFRRFV